MNSSKPRAASQPCLGASSDPNGMGVGLSICRSVIENHNGRLWGEASDGPGATFSFCIPGVPATPVA
jgi:signal transduction histidine kinase